MAAIINGDGIFTAEGTSSTQGRVRLNEDTDNGTNYVELQAAASIASNVTFTLPAADGTNGQVLQTNGSGALSFATISAGPNVQTFTSSGTWTKPSSGSIALIRAWGAGGSGSKDSTQGGGGGGGAYVERWIPLASLGATETVTIGSGGASRTANNTGANGGNTTFGSLLTAYGGGGGGQYYNDGSDTWAPGGGGGSLFSAGGVGGNGNDNWGSAGQPNGGGGVQARLRAMAAPDASGNGGNWLRLAVAFDAWAGAAGSGTQRSANYVGNAFYGGAGGGSVGGFSTVAAGTSIGGGNGGAGGTTGTAGVQPGGGGGGSTSGNSGAGGDGQVIVYVW